MRSMTGFGRGSADSAEHGLKIDIEISSVNRKNLDVFVAAPRDWTGIDQRCNEWIKPSFLRGRVNVQIKVESTEGSQDGLVWSPKTMDESVERLRKYAESRQLAFNVDSRLLLDLAKCLKDSSSLPDWREIETPLRAALNQALKDINEMRSNEGEALAADLMSRIDELDELRSSIAAHATVTVEKYRDALMERLKQLDLDIDINDERVLKEVALFADRSDISEELTRLKCHFEQFRDFLKSDDATGLWRHRS